MLANAVIMLLGFVTIALACTYSNYLASFWISLASSILLGTVSALGESTTLGFCKGFPSSVVGYFGSGTGFAGIFGAGLIIILQSVGLSNGLIFFLIAPSCLPYVLSFFWLTKMKARYPYILESEKTDNEVPNYSDDLTGESPNVEQKYLADGMA